MKPILTTFIMSLFLMGLYSQQTDTISLDHCFRLLSERSPVVRKRSVSNEISDIRITNLTTNWLPEIVINAQANYNSETIDFSELMEGIPVTMPEIPLDQYKIWAEISQPIFDGGITSSRKKAERTAVAVEIQQTEIDLYHLKQKVLQVYFALLLAEKNRQILEVSLDELRTNIEVMHAGVDNGVVMPENLMVMEAEELKMEQMIDEVDFSSHTMINTLSVLIDSTLAAYTHFSIPVAPDILTSEAKRPELKLFEKQKAVFDANKRLIASSSFPKIFAFSQLAYGRPGFNMTSRDFHDYYSVGLGMKWNFLNYGDNRRKIKILDLQKDMVDIQNDSFDDQMSIQLQTEEDNIRKYDELLKKDDKILQLRKEITLAAFSKLNNGIISSTDYLSEFNKEILAHLQLENHRLLKIQAVYNYLFMQGAL